MSVETHIPEVVLLHTPDVIDPAIVLATAEVTEPFNLYEFSIPSVEEIDEFPSDTRGRLIEVMEDRSLSHLLIQDRLMDPVARAAKLAIGYACWYSPTQEGFLFGTFDVDNNVTVIPLEEAKDRAQFIKIPDFKSILDTNQV